MFTVTDIYTGTETTATAATLGSGSAPKIWTNVISEGVRAVKADGVDVGTIVKGEFGWSVPGDYEVFDTFRQAAGHAAALHGGRS